MGSRPLRVLVFCEGATLAHITRPLALAELLPDTEYEIHLAIPSSFEWVAQKFVGTRHYIECQSSEVFARRLAKGAPLYDYETLVGYVTDDLALISRVVPDAVVGDFRISLSVSARLARIPYLAISDAYWSSAHPTRMPMPVLPGTARVPLALSGAIFKLLAPAVVKLHTWPMSQLRKKFSLPPLSEGLSQVYQDSDCTMFANIPSLFPDVVSINEGRFVGPLSYALPCEVPDWWDSIPPREECTFICLGSSGDIGALQCLTDAVCASGKAAIVATAGRAHLPHAPERRRYVADYLPGEIACRAASLVISNGGSPMSQLALSCGVPVLGVPTNMDQFLCMSAIERAGMGALVRSDRCSAATIGAALRRFSASPDLAQHAATVYREMDRAACYANLHASIASLCAQ